MGELSRSQLRDAPPTHFRLRIESFSTLSSSWPGRLESSVFSAADYKWKLALYPNGNKSRDGEDHISLYLVLDIQSKLEKEILVSFTLLLFDHVREKYFSVQEVSSFGPEKTESGFDKFLPLKNFIDPSNGYLFNDTCIFGADIYIIENTPKEQCISMMTSKPAPYKYTWKVDKFSGLQEELYISPTFITRGHDWRLKLYPKGNGTEKNNSLSLYLELADSESLLTDGKQVFVEAKLRIIDRVGKNHQEHTYTKCHCASTKNWGVTSFLALSNLNKSTAGYLVDDTCIIEADVNVLGSAKNLG